MSMLFCFIISVPNSSPPASSAFSGFKNMNSPLSSINRPLNYDNGIDPITLQPRNPFLPGKLTKQTNNTLTKNKICANFLYLIVVL